MRIVVGHANPDFDAYAATVAATKLFEGAKGVFLGTQNANVRRFHNLHEDFLDFVDLKGLDLDSVDEVIMVDTRDPDRIGEIGSLIGKPGVNVIVYDHHPPQEGDHDGGDDRSLDVGSTTSILVHEIKQKGIELAPIEASAMLLGIHEDTGSLTYPNATAYDADAAAYLMAVGADMEVLNQFLARTLDAGQQELLRQLETSLEVWNVNGQEVAVGVADAEEYVDSASVLTHYIVEDMGFRVAVAIVRMPERVQIVARSRLSEVDVGAVMARVGGGGHAQAASAGFRELELDEAVERVRAALVAELPAPLRAADVMSAPVRTVGPAATMREAGELMARWGHGGLPVLEDHRILGMITRKDVDKALGHGLGHAPVTGFMGRDVVTVAPDMTLSDLERLLASRGIGRLPVVDGGAMIGIVTRKDVLRAEHGDAYLDRRLARSHPQATEKFLGGVEALLPEPVREALTRLGQLAEERGVKAHVVGGFVRDMVLGRRNLDIDVVIEGDGVAFAEEAAAAMGGRVRIHRRFGTAVIVLSRDFHVDVASSRAEYYTKPGALPTVERSTLRQDLFRRDFTINAMAACIDPICFGQLADPFGGLRDLERGVIRVMHALSFIDDPTRILRASRFEERYGFRMDAATESQARRAVEMRMLAEVSGARIREELGDIFDEDRPGEVFERLRGLGALTTLVPEGAAMAGVSSLVAKTDESVRVLAESLGRAVRRRYALAGALCFGASRSQCERWLRHFRFGREYSEVVLTVAGRLPQVMRALRDRRGMRDSRLYRLLAPLPAEALAVAHAASEGQARERIERFAADLAQEKPAVNGRDLIGMGYEPTEAFAAILARAFDDRLDGRAVGREAELANLRRCALRALGAPEHRGDRA